MATLISAPPRDSGVRAGLSPRAWLLLAIAITVAVYAPSLHFNFVDDDWPQIVGNPRVQSWRYLPGYFTEHVWAQLFGYGQANYYRPLFMVWLLLNSSLFGMNPLGWHLTTLLAHLAAGGLAYMLARELLGRSAPAPLVAAVFLLHPVQTESVAWVAGVSEPLLACATFGCYWAFLRWINSRARPNSRMLVLSLACYLAALLIKETAAVLPGVILSYLLLCSQESLSDRVRRAARVALPYAATLLVYFALRLHALQGALHAQMKTSAVTWALSLPSLAWFYVTHLIAPVRLALCYDLNLVTTPGTRFWLPLIALVGLTFGLWLWARRWRLAGFAALLIVSHLLMPLAASAVFGNQDVVHDRYLYIPVFGFALLVALAVERLPSSLLRFSAAVVVIAACVAGTLVAESAWKDNLTLYSRAVAVSPRAMLPKVLLASALTNAGDLGRAYPLLLEARRISPNEGLPESQLAAWYYKAARYSEAETALHRAMQLHRPVPYEWELLADINLQLGRPPAAIEAMHHALGLVPGNISYRLKLASMLEASGDLPAAIAEYRLVLAQSPEEIALRDHITRLENRRPRP